jgi:predicted peptidase
MEFSQKIQKMIQGTFLLVLPENDDDIPYQIYLPPEFSQQEFKEKRWPLILFLHGSGERGSDGIKPTQAGLGPLVKKYPSTFPAIIIFPQASEKMWWSLNSGLFKAYEVLQRVIQNYPVDEDRIYLSGISMGGYGSWELAETYPKLFAAIVPIAASKEPGLLTKNLNKIPIWAVHGQDDVICPVEATISMVEAIRSAGNEEVELTIYCDYCSEFSLGHKEAWEMAYQNTELIEWLFSQNRNASARKGEIPSH